jgi:hypothetical protein
VEAQSTVTVALVAAVVGLAGVEAQSTVTVALVAAVVATANLRLR